MIDWGRVNELRDEVGADDFSEVVEIFLEEVEEVIGRLRDRGTETHLDDLHFLKGSALNLGFAELATACTSAEQLAANGAAAPVDPSPVVACYDTSKAEFLAGLENAAKAA